MTDLHKANTKLTSLTRFDTLPIASSFCVASPTFLILEGNGFFSKDAFLLCAMNQNTGSLAPSGSLTSIFMSMLGWQSYRYTFTKHGGAQMGVIYPIPTT